MRKLGLVLLALAGSAVVGARAEETPESRVAAARGGIASLSSALDAYAKAEAAESETKPLIEDFLAGIDANAPEPDPTLPADTLEQERLATFEEHVGDLAARLLARRNELLYGVEAAPVATAAAPQESALLDVQSIMSEPADSPGPVLGIPTHDTTDPLGAVKGRVRVLDEEGLQWALGNLLDNAPGVTWSYTHGLVQVKGPPAEVARTRDFVAALREATGARVSLDIRAYRMKRELWRELARGGVALSADDEARLRRAVAAGEASVLAGQTIVARDGQVVHAWRGSSRTYVSGFELNFTGVSPVANTVTDRLDTGLAAELRANVDPFQKSVLLDLSLVLCEPRPSAKETIQGFEIELPEVATARTVTTVSLPLGRGALVAGTFGSKGTEVDAPLASVLYVRATLVPISREGTKTVIGPPAPPPAKPEPRPLRAGVTDAEKAEAERLEQLLAKVEAHLVPVREARKLRWAFFDVRELLEGRREHTAPHLGLPARPKPAPANGANMNGGVLTFGDGEEEVKREKALPADAIEHLTVTGAGGDRLWGDSTRRQILGGNFLVLQTPGAIAAIASTLASLETARTRTVCVETALYELSPELVAALDAGAHDGSLDKEQLAKIEASGQLVASGFVAARPGDRVHVHQGTERAYVSKYLAWSAGTSEKPEKGSQPAIATLTTGIELEAKLREDASGTLGVEASVTLARLKELARSATPDGTIAAPVLDLDELAATAPLPPGGGAIVTVTKDGKTLALVIRATAP